MNTNIVEALSQIAREKNVDRELVVQTLADALISAAKKRYGNTENYEAVIDSTTGTMEVTARKTVVEDVEEPSLEIDLEEAQSIDGEVQVGGVIVEQLDLADFGRNAIQTAKQILVQRVREAERERIYEAFSGRTNQIEAGTVQQISRGDIILNLGRAEAAIPLKEQIRRERYRQGDTVRGYIYEVLKSSRGPQVLLSRTHPEFLKKLFALEVPEIAEGIVEMHAVAREPGERAKIAVSSSDERVDPVGACVGVKGARVQAIVRELSGERIDIVPWIDEPDIFISRALSPADILRVITDHRRRHATVIVEENQLSLAIGKSGQNSRLAVQLTGWGLDLISEDEYQNRRTEVEKTQQILRQIPGVSELIALSLATSGFNTIGDVIEASVEMLRSVPGLEDEESVLTLQKNAQAHIDEHGEGLVENGAEEPPAEEINATATGEPALEDQVQGEGEVGDPADKFGVPAEKEESTAVGEVAESGETGEAEDTTSEV